MRRFISRRPSPAMIIAVVALIAALGGTAIAGGGFLPKSKFSKFKKNTAVKSLTYVNNTVTVPNNNTDFTTVSATCPTGFNPVGGGVKLTPPDGSFWWDDGYLTATGYAAKINNDSGTERTALITVACVAARANGTPAG